MNRRLAWCAGAVIALVVSAAAAADTLESVEKSILEKSGSFQSCQGRVVSTQNMQTEQMKLDSQSDTTFECLKKGEKWLFRAESKTKSVNNMGGQEQKQDTTTLIVCDGEFLWTQTEMNGQKSVMKMRPTAPISMVTDKATFENLHKEFDLKLLPDEKVDGKSCWAIEATPKQAMPDGMLATMVNYFDKDTGLNLKTVGKDKAGKVVLTSETKEFKLDPPLKAERFEYKAPEGVQVMDMTQAQPAGEQPTTKPAEPKKEEPRKDEPKKEEPKKEEKKDEKPKLPKVPKLP